MFMTVLRLVALLAVVAVSVSPTGGTMSGGDDELLPRPYLPEENQFQKRAEVLNNGHVLSVTDRVLLLKIRPNVYGTYAKDGTMTTYFEVVPAEPQKYYIHTCLWNGGLAIDATDNFSYAAKDVKAGDQITVDYVTDPQGHRWVNRISIWQRPGGVLPPERRKLGVDADGSTTCDRWTARLFRIHNAKMQQQVGGK